MKSGIFKVLITFVFITSSIYATAQIEDIKKNSKENKSNKSNKSSSSSSSSSSSDDFGAGCMADMCGGCFNAGVSVFFAMIVENHQSMMNLLEKDPSILSFEVRANFALGIHYSKNKNYTYVNYLPGLRGNLGAFSTDFRFNVLTEYTNDFPNSFTSWEWLFLFNIEPVETFKLSFGTGVQAERFSDSYFNEHYIGFKFGLANNKDYIDLDTRFSIDYETGAFPFFEAAVHFKKRIAELESAFMHITVGGVYQNYYQSNDIWAFQAGLIVNVH